MAKKSIKEAIHNGSRQKQACEIVGISPRTLQNWHVNGLVDGRQEVEKVPANKLSQKEREAIIKICNNSEFKDKSPKQIVPALADKGEYMASESSFYRILRDVNQLEHRGRSKSPTVTNKPHAYTAVGPNQVWSWDITYLARNIMGTFYYLYLFLDIYSRKIVGWEVYENESSEHAADILRKTRLSEGLSINHELVLHSDNGSPMKGATMLATMQKLGIMPSFSRPSVSNDNPFSESLFKTLKYTPSYTSKPFENIDEARKWVASFTNWYNYCHYHSGLKFVTPVQRHNGGDVIILKQREEVYKKAKEKHPERWSGKTRNWKHEPVVMLNPANKQQPQINLKIAA